ncbi:MAG: phosphate signaling complex protein PhoU [Cyanobacteria bacterium P01_A01_bin.84]
MMINQGRPQLTRDIRRIERDILRMGALVETSFRLSHEALIERNLAAANEISRIDKKVDKLYRQIETDCIAIMTLQAPVAQDLRCLSVFMQLVRDLERIGDYAEDISEIAIKIFPYEPHSTLPEIARMSHHAQAMLATSLKCLADMDEVCAKELKQLDDVVDNAYEHLYKTLANQENVDGVIEPLLLLGLAIRFLERMADHATNIGQRVAYMITGDRY